VRTLLPGVIVPDSGLGGILAVRLGGCGNELILTVFRIDLPALFIPAPFGIGRVMVGAGDRGGPVADGALSPLRGVPRVLVGLPIPPVLLRLFDTGKAGRAPFGGSLGPRGRGSVVAIAVWDEHVYSAQICKSGKVRFTFHASMRVLALIAVGRGMWRWSVG